jgi:hypothetical protein
MTNPFFHHLFWCLSFWRKKKLKGRGLILNYKLVSKSPRTTVSSWVHHPRRSWSWANRRFIQSSLPSFLSFWLATMPAEESAPSQLSGWSFLAAYAADRSNCRPLGITLCRNRGKGPSAMALAYSAYYFGHWHRFRVFDSDWTWTRAT